MKRFYLFLGIILAIAACKKQEEPDNNNPENPGTKTEAPKVVSTVPQNNAVDVEGLEEIVITYDKDIQLAPNTTISLNGTWMDSGVYVQAKSLYIPVTLESGKAYTLNVKNPSVKDADGNFAPDFTLTFTTKSANAFDASAFSISAAPANVDANAATKNLYFELAGNFGKKIYSSVNAGEDWSLADAQLLETKTGKAPKIAVFTVADELPDIAPITAWAQGGGIAAVRWNWVVPSEDPNPQPDPEMEGDEIIDFEDVVIGNWDAFQYLDNSYFTKCVVGSTFTVYYKNAAAGAQMALKHNVEGWPGVVDADGNNYEYFDIQPGSGSFTLGVDSEVLKVLCGAGIVIGGHDYTIMGVGLKHPTEPVNNDYVEEFLDFDDVVIGNWDAWKYLDAAALANCVPGTKMVIHYKDAAGAQMGFRVNIDGWPNLVDGNGREYGYFNIADGEGDYTLKIDEVVLEAIAEPGIIIAGMNYTVCGVTFKHPVGGSDVEYEEETISFGDGVPTGNWADYRYLEPSTFVSCIVGSKLVVNYKDAIDGAQMALKTNSDGWPGIVDENGTNYQYFVIAAGEGKFALEVDALVLQQLRSTGLIIGGHDYTIMSLVICNPKTNTKVPVLRCGFARRGFTADEALQADSWQHKVLDDDLAKMAAYLKSLGDQPVIFSPVGEAFKNGSPQAAAALWQYMFGYMSGEGVNNLLWYWTIGTPEAYPGDPYVDIVGVDASGMSSYDSAWANLLGHVTNKSVFTLSSVHSLPSVANCLSTGCMWLWATPAEGSLKNHEAGFLKDWMDSDYVITK